MKSEGTMYEFIKDNEIEKIVLEHILNSNKIEEQGKDSIKRIFEQLVTRLLLQIKLNIEKNVAYKEVEALFYEMKEVEQVLEKAIHDLVQMKEAKEVVFEDKSLFEDLIDIVDTIKSELPTEKNNSLEYERTLLVSTEVLKIKEAMYTYQQEIVQNFVYDVNLDMDFEEIVAKYLMGQYNQDVGKMIAMVRKSIRHINKWENREEIIRYKHIVEEQIKVIETLLEMDFNMQATNKKYDINKIIIEPMQKVEKEMFEIIKQIEEASKKEPVDGEIIIKNTEKIVIDTIKEDAGIKDANEMIDSLKNTTLHVVLQHVNDELNKGIDKEQKRIKRTSRDIEMLSYIIVEIFEDAITKLNISREKIVEEDETLTKIVDGLVDTILLKLDALKEKDSQFHMKKREAYLEISKNLMEYKGIFRENCAHYLKESIEQERNAFQVAQQNFEKIVKREEEKNRNFDHTYMSNEILSEIITLEELLHHSVQKLLESQNEGYITFGEIFVELFRRIQVQLEKKSIYRIVPKEHDMFNGKIHVVLMAIEKSGYTKGEVISYKTSGYRYMEKVLLRANVICAK